MSSGKKVLGYTPGPAVGSSYNTKPDSTSQADWKMVLNKRKSDRRCVKRRENRAAEEEKQADEKLAAELGREKKSKRESLAVDPVVSPPALRSPSPAATLLDLASLDDEVTLRYDGSPERTARSPQSGDGDGSHRPIFSVEGQN